MTGHGHDMGVSACGDTRASRSLKNQNAGPHYHQNECDVIQFLEVRSLVWDVASRSVLAVSFFSIKFK